MPMPEDIEIFKVAPIRSGVFQFKLVWCPRISVGERTCKTEVPAFYFSLISLCPNYQGEAWAFT
jgi:hypothetical protein